MAEHPAAPLLAADFGRLPHTNKLGEKGFVQLPGFGTAGMSKEQADARAAGEQARANNKALQALAGRVDRIEAHLGLRPITARDIRALEPEIPFQAAERIAKLCNQLRTGQAPLVVNISGGSV